MRAVVQRASRASVQVEGATVGEITQGLVALLGVDEDDTQKDAKYIADKIVGLRIFNDAEGKFNLSLGEVQGEVLLVSQFTLHGDCRRGRRPSFIRAARPETAIPLYETVATVIREKGFTVATGQFGAHMELSLVNDGPVTLLLDSEKVF